MSTGTWLAWSQVNDIAGRVAQEWTPAGTALSDGPSAAKVAEVKAYDTGDAVSYDRAYTYDGAQRLTKVADHTAAVTGVIFDPTAPPAVGCTVRSYAYTGPAGDNGSRTAQASTDYPGADCTTAPGATTSRGYAYDSADRPTTGAAINGGPAGAAYVYDPLSARQIGSKRQAIAVTRPFPLLPPLEPAKQLGALGVEFGQPSNALPTRDRSASSQMSIPLRNSGPPAAGHLATDTGEGPA